MTDEVSEDWGKAIIVIMFKKGEGRNSDQLA